MQETATKMTCASAGLGRRCPGRDTGPACGTQIPLQVAVCPKCAQLPGPWGMGWAVLEVAAPGLRQSLSSPSVNTACFVSRQEPASFLGCNIENMWPGTQAVPVQQGEFGVKQL